MKEFCTANGITIDKIIKEIGGGLNFKRKKFITLLSQVMTGLVESIYVAHKDRLCRFAFDLVEQIATINGTRLDTIKKALTNMAEKADRIFMDK